jgi:hypothetical protein
MRKASGLSMIKAKKTLAELETMARSALHRSGVIVGQVAIAPACAQIFEANWALLHIDSEREIDPMLEELIRPIQARYDLAW